MDLDKAILKVEADTQPLSTALKNVQKEADQSFSSIVKMSEKIGVGFINAAVKGESLKGVLHDLLSDLARSTFKQTVSDPLSSLVGSFVGHLFGRASGGSVSQNVPYLVGERGPELFTPSSAGRITSDPAMTNQSSNESWGVNISIDARGADAGAAERLRSVASDIQNKTFEAVFAAMNRGGRYARMSGRR